MRLYSEIFKNINPNAFSRCVIIPCGGGYFEGVKGMEEFSVQRVVIRFPKERVEVLGEGFSIAKYCDGDLEIAGKILSVRALVEER